MMSRTDRMTGSSKDKSGQDCSVPNGRWPQSETDVAGPIVEWLRDEAWEVYQEIQPERNGPIADIVAIRDNVVWVIEAKRGVSLNLLKQAHGWRERADLISIAVPSANGCRVWDYVECVLQRDGIGAFGVNRPDSGKDRVEMLIRPRRFENADRSYFRQFIIPQHQDYAIAGNAKGRRLTNFGITRMRVQHYVLSHPGCRLAELVSNIDSHYSTEAVARRTIPRKIRDGSIRGVRIRKVNGRLKFYPIRKELNLILGEG